MSKSPKKSIDFQCHAAEAKQVFLAGTFNDWQPDATPMESGENGLWTQKLKLSPGHYEYKYIVDGEWCCRPADTETEDCPHCVPNEFGSQNQTLDVK